MICGMKGNKTIAAENRWDNLITEISAEKKKTITNSNSTMIVDIPGRWKNNILKEFCSSIGINLNFKDTLISAFNFQANILNKKYMDDTIEETNKKNTPKCNYIREFLQTIKQVCFKDNKNLNGISEITKKIKDEIINKISDFDKLLDEKLYVLNNEDLKENFFQEMSRFLKPKLLNKLIELDYFSDIKKAINKLCDEFKNNQNHKKINKKR